MLPESDVKQVRVGAKQASETVKRTEHESFQGAKDMYEKQSEMLRLEGNDEENCRGTRVDFQHHMFHHVLYTVYRNVTNVLFKVLKV